MAAIICEKVGQIGKIWLNRPDVKNTINTEMMVGFQNALDDMIADENIRVVIIQGKGDNFCGGFDVGTSAAKTWTLEYRRARTQEEISMWYKIIDCDKPFIIGLQGEVMGGGALMTSVCDIVVVAEDTTINNEELAWGLTYTNYLPFDAWKLPMNIAKECMYTGMDITAQKGYQYGLFNYVVQKDQVDETCMKIARRMLQVAPLTLKAHKEIMTHCYDLQGMRSSVMFAREIFNLSRLSEGTEANREFWKNVTEKGPATAAEIAHQKLMDAVEGKAE